MENKRIPFSEASDGEIKKLVENSAQGNTKKNRKIYRNDLLVFALRNYSKFHSCPRSFASWPTVQFSDNLSISAERALFTKYFAAKVTRYVHVSENVHTTTALNSLH